MKFEIKSALTSCRAVALYVSLGMMIVGSVVGQMLERLSDGLDGPKIICMALFCGGAVLTLFSIARIIAATGRLLIRRFQSGV